MKKAQQKAEFNTFAKMLEALPHEASCRNYLEQLIWKGEPVCPHCGTKNK